MINKPLFFLIFEWVFLPSKHFKLGFIRFCRALLLNVLGINLYINKIDNTISFSLMDRSHEWEKKNKKRETYFHSWFWSLFAVWAKDKLPWFLRWRWGWQLIIFSLHSWLVFLFSWFCLCLPIQTLSGPSEWRELGNFACWFLLLNCNNQTRKKKKTESTNLESYYLTKVTRISK